MATKYALVITNFVYLDGTPVANGTVKIRLSLNGSVSDAQVSSQFTTITLDASGNVTGSPTFYRPDDISPSGTYYVELVNSAQGQLVAGPNIASIS